MSSKRSLLRFELPSPLEMSGLDSEADSVECMMMVEAELDICELHVSLSGVHLFVAGSHIQPEIVAKP